MANLPPAGELLGLIQAALTPSKNNSEIDSIVDAVKQEVVSLLASHIESILGRYRESIRGLVEEMNRVKTDNAIREEDYKSDIKDLREKQETFFSTILFLKSQNLKLEHTCLALKSEIGNKADALTLFKTMKIVDTMTPLREFHDFLAYSKNFVTQEDNQKTTQQLNSLQNLYFAESKDFIRTKEAARDIKVFREEIQSKFDLYITKEGLLEYSDRVNKEIKEIMDSYRQSQIHNEKAFSQIRTDLVLLVTNFESEPWKVNNNSIKELLFKKADKDELRTLSHEVRIPIKKFSISIDQFKDEICKFHAVIARFDEVLLCKASKEDVHRLDHTLSLMNLKSDADKFERDMQIQISNIEFCVEHHKEAIEFLKQQVIKAINKDSPLLTYNKEFVIITEQINDLNEILKSKADKADYLTLLESIGRKDDVSKLKDLSSRLHKTLEVLIILMQALTRSTLQSAETATVKDKSRIQVYKHLMSLLKWVSKNDTPDDENLLNTSRLILTRNSKRAQTPGNQTPIPRAIDPNLSLDDTSSYNIFKGSRITKFKPSSIVIQSTTLEPKFPIDLPPLKYNNLNI